ncbi:DUF29 family protein [Rhodopila sp.]|uniref:DUF29 family protein n=1 Tax=Rhodopila sp. TaxID=2480087 RepID=UPI003D14CE18
MQSLLQQILVHLLKLHGWPQRSAAGPWRAEIVAFQADLCRRFAPSMRQRIDLPQLYDLAATQVGKLRHAHRASSRTLPSHPRRSADQIPRGYGSLVRRLLTAPRRHLPLWLLPGPSPHTLPKPSRRPSAIQSGMPLFGSL